MVRPNLAPMFNVLGFSSSTITSLLILTATILRLVLTCDALAGEQINDQGGNIFSRSSSREGQLESLPKRAQAMPPKSSIIVPLYVYPEDGAWDPLYEAISKHPSLNFIIIVNPEDGPGSSPYPDDNYLQEIPKLNGYPNVLTVGYVPINYARRPIQKVLDEISIYAGWNQKIAKEGDSGTTTLEVGRLAVHGIFFDETPYLASTKTTEYLGRIDRFVRDAVGIAVPKMVIHNPGCIPDRKLFSNNPGPDVTVVYEQAYSTYASNKMLRSGLAALPFSRSRLCYMMHSLPEKDFRDKRGFTDMVRELRLRAEYIFLTNLRRDFYSSFDPGWMRFVEAMDE